MENQLQSGRKFYFSVLNVLGCLGVIYLHCNGVVWSFPTGSLWVTSNIIETVFYWPVPIFYMLTGATLVDYRNRYSTKEFFRKRTMRTLIPFLFWSLIGILYCYFLKKPPAEDLSLQTVITNIFSTRYVSIYWFFIPLFAIYLSMPVISMINEKMKIFPYCIMLGLVFVSILPFVCRIIGIVYNGTLTPGVVSGFLIYVFLGYYLANADFKKKQRIIIYLLGLSGWAVRYLANVFLVANDHMLMNVYGGYTNFPAVFQSAAVFLFFRYAGLEKAAEKHPKLSDFTDKLAGMSFGIYLCHIYLVEQIPAVFGFDRAETLWRVLGPIVLYAVCADLVWVMKKLPVLKNMVP